ncbi:histidine kinase [Rhizobacter sp. AJA081-3]|uniref:sensor histidine kinase n=1 Tax=Rhizobacter sp. AJA081-3 TaxID=2753607 RepID=UPI001AE0039A|nr:histidine kinase [Rhizobacter sp. AJA081-3]QTN23504.1 histidine kinase [Rhizobacter sp. AJA081-3]
MSIPPVPPAPPIPPLPPLPPRPVPPGRWQAFKATALSAFHAYGNWLVGISWWRFALLAVLLLIITGIAQNIPPFSWPTPQWFATEAPQAKAPAPPKSPVVRLEGPQPADTAASGAKSGVEISISGKGIIVRPNAEVPAGAASDPTVHFGKNSIEIKVPPGADSEEVRQAIEDARAEIADAIEDARDAKSDAKKAADVTVKVAPKRKPRRATFGDSLPELAFLWIAMSIILKITYKGRLQAEVKAAQATETAEAESLKRQVVEARMAAMQAQVEPHFLFNTLASIDHLIETDPKRASVMQKNLIALLRASMPTMRETAANGVRDLGRELAVIAPYLEILKVRMEDRLSTLIDVPEGLRSAEFPPMMIQSLVENAIKHGLEPKPEGGSLAVKAEIVHGKLAVTVADSGLGFGKAATAGTGIGLNNIRERLQLLYGNRASLSVGENLPSGTRVTITVPYVAQARDGATMAA